MSRGVRRGLVDEAEEGMRASLCCCVCLELEHQLHPTEPPGAGIEALENTPLAS